MNNLLIHITPLKKIFPNPSKLNGIIVIIILGIMIIIEFLQQLIVEVIYIIYWLFEIMSS